ncbi:MAG: choice-of-anchor tandem repeat GloVer-containing protein [Candidatus Sulfotelmatobacter sp.]
MKRMQNQNKSLRISVVLLTLLMLALAGTVPAKAQTFTSLYSFGQVDPTQVYPDGQLVQGRDGNLYGELNQDQAQIYRMTPEGTETVLFVSASDDGNACYTGLALGLDGLLYGTCGNWGFDDSVSGIIFKLDPSSGAFTIIYSWPAFGGQGGEGPSALTLGNDGNFYGTTQGDLTNTLGTVFKVTPSGTYTTLHAFQGESGSDGANPSETSNGNGYPIPLPLILAKDGNFYGTTDEGGLPGQQNGGTAYRITPQGRITILYDFVNGESPSGMTQGKDGNFYGQTALAGTNGYGSIFKLTPTGQLTTIYNFNSTTDNAAYPKYLLMLGPDGNFYDVSDDYESGGYGSANSIFEVTAQGKFTDLFSGFQTGACEPETDGCIPSSPLLLHTNGTFYGTTAQGGVESRGMFYSFSKGLAQFASLQTTAGREGATINILGQGFSTATKVSFGGTSAAFSVSSDTFMTATVPNGALTGTVSVTESGATLNSIQSFEVAPVVTSFSPSSGPVGTAVVINGSGLMQTTKVTFGGVAATGVTVTSDKKVTADVPTGAITGSIVVTTKGGSATNSKSFTVN